MGAPQPAQPERSGPPSPPGAVTPAGPGQGTRPLNWVMLVAGVLLTSLGLALSGAGILLAAVDASQRDGNYAYTDPEELS